MYISRIKVVNFRSLVEVDVELVGYNALVGLNDSGKSNLLRALNLFFNNETDLERSLVFATDFSQQARVVGKKAKQIEIEIEVSPPNNYADKGPIIWRKTYRADSPNAHTDEIYKKDKTEFSRGSRTEYWVRHIAFEYVPAIRGRHFFAILKRRLYTTLATTVAPKLTGASTNFLSDLRKEVKKIESESKRLLDLQTEFSLPSDLGDLFEILDFDASDAHARTALTQRGDGIQGRHIPLILKFLADQRKKNSAMGKPPTETIWGFEEPENNLELSKQIDVASEFKDYSRTIQVIVSTHSPAFYGKAKTEGRVWIAKRNLGRTDFVDCVSPQEVDEHLGLMPFVQPYLAKAVQERNELIDAVKSLSEEALVKNKPALYVEGSTDKTILSAALEALKLPANFDIVAKDGLGGGTNWVVGCCVARAAMTDLRKKTAALLDADNAGSIAFTQIRDRTEAIGRPNRIKCFVVAKNNGNDHVRIVKASQIKIPFAIEELCGPEAWDHAASKGWLIERGAELVNENTNLLSKTTTFLDVLNKRISDPHSKRMVEYKVAEKHKGNFSNFVAQFFTSGFPVPASLETLAKDISTYFD
ncbi:MAG: AAA family ATPase [Hylemonella sp.]|nr:AAA family ATPase [Hylemonella sp.]